MHTESRQASNRSLGSLSGSCPKSSFKHWGLVRSHSLLDLEHIRTIFKCYSAVEGAVGAVDVRRCLDFVPIRTINERAFHKYLILIRCRKQPAGLTPA
jgi:hypothetical protein